MPLRIKLLSNCFLVPHKTILLSNAHCQSSFKKYKKRTASGRLQCYSSSSEHKDRKSHLKFHHDIAYLIQVRGIQSECPYKIELLSNSAMRFFKKGPPRIGKDLKTDPQRVQHEKIPRHRTCLKMWVLYHNILLKSSIFPIFLKFLSGEIRKNQIAILIPYFHCFS